MSTLVDDNDTTEFVLVNGSDRQCETPSVIWTLTGRATDDGPSATIDIAPRRFRIGRRGENNLCIPNDTVSGQHAELLSLNGELFVTDLRSTNGTLVNGMRISSPVPLKDGDILHFGSAMYTLATDSGDKPRSTLVSDTEGDAIAQVLFKQLLTESGITPYFQPIVRFDDSSIIAYEGLARSQFVGLETPDKMCRVAAQQSSEVALATECRRAAVHAMAASPAGGLLQCYLNTHPSELDLATLIQSLRKLRERYHAQMLTLEVH